MQNGPERKLRAVLHTAPRRERGRHWAAYFTVMVKACVLLQLLALV